MYSWNFVSLRKPTTRVVHTAGMEEGVGPPPRADCDRSWVNMEGAQADIGEGVGPPQGRL